MIPVKMPYANAVLQKEGYEDLPATQFHFADDGDPGIETVWELTPEELEIVKQTGKIYVYTVGQGVPPMFLSASGILQTDSDGGTPNEDSRES